ncbi:hypothetical protein PIB30_004106 [Stylosanthes scabra]|uniref:Uncharacterized protein n=1 Tax=Stylosanthes scabra TaxID=79078 RepID=A0ABU6Z3C1_9FABA|nr:hypothetical protein [Stylosanthes scabra]
MDASSVLNALHLRPMLPYPSPLPYHHSCLAPQTAVGSLLICSSASFLRALCSLYSSPFLKVVLRPPLNLLLLASRELDFVGRRCCCACIRST